MNFLFRVYPRTMWYRSTLLRVVVSLGVILNGSPFAMAASSVGMHIHSEKQVVAQNTEGDVTALPSCHEAARTNSNSTHQHPSMPTSASLAKSSSPAPDCCKSGRCSCACVHAAATLPSFRWIALAEIHRSIICPLNTDLPAPILPHLSRPPIV